MSTRLDTTKIGEALRRAARKAASNSLDARAGRFVDPAAKSINKKECQSLATSRRADGVVRQPDRGSAVIGDIAYDASAQRLQITFTTGRIYIYEPVPRAAYEAFAAADSRGAHFNAHIRDAYAYREL